MHTLSIIGTAGRAEDAHKLKRGSYQLMYNNAREAVKRAQVSTLVSGGAAWADHLAVSLFLNNEVDQLILHLPAPFEHGQYVEGSKAGGIANYYHRKFAKTIAAEVSGISTLDDIGIAIEKGARIHVYNGFFERNLEVARSDLILAYTFGTADGKYMPGEPGFGDAKAAGLKDGGTAHTWNHAHSALAKRHVNLHTLLEIR
jgi:hypothetical protein